MHIGGTSLAGIAPNVDGLRRRCCPTSSRCRGTTPRRSARRSSALGRGPGRGVLLRADHRRRRGVRRRRPATSRGRAQVCRETGVLFVADEVITGFGRTGEWFASTRWGLEPDLVTCAKGITSGYLPLGAVIAAPSVWEPFFAEGAGMFRHGYTYSGHAAVAAAAIANLDIMEQRRTPGACGRAGGTARRGAPPARRPRAGERGPRRHRRARGRAARPRAAAPPTPGCSAASCRRAARTAS